MRVHIATDHAGMELSQYLVEQLSQRGFEMIDHGPEVYDRRAHGPRPRCGPSIIACCDVRGAWHHGQNAREAPPPLSAKMP
jgi:hypothetical protein